MLNLTISKLRFIAKERNTDGYQNISKKKKKKIEKPYLHSHLPYNLKNVLPHKHQDPPQLTKSSKMAKNT